MSGTLRVGRGRAAMTITGPTADELIAAVRRVLGPALDLMEDEIQPIYDKLQTTWPVKTKKSLRAWKMVVRMDPTKMAVGVALHNPLRYVLYIKTTKKLSNILETRVRSPSWTDVRTPINKANKRLRTEYKALLPLLLQAEIDRG